MYGFIPLFPNTPSWYGQRQIYVYVSGDEGCCVMYHTTFYFHILFSVGMRCDANVQIRRSCTNLSAVGDSD
jgi:hypothetical protein